MRLAGRGPRPAPGRPGHLRDRGRRGVAGRGERPVPAARRTHRHRRDARRAQPGGRAGAAPQPGGLTGPFAAHGHCQCRGAASET
ncbi:Exonuclease SbcC [Streptomyces misionensis JCM 4497]